METTISLKFILKEDTKKRAAAYFLYHHYEELSKSKYFDENTKIGGIIKNNIEDEKYKEVLELVNTKKEAFNRLIERNVTFKEIDELRRKKLKRKKKKYIPWYEMCSDITNFRQLMESVGLKDYYESLYGGISMETHGYNAAMEMVSREGKLYLKELRSGMNGYTTVDLTSKFSISALEDVYLYLGDGEEEKENLWIII